MRMFCCLGILLTLMLLTSCNRSGAGGPLPVISYVFTYPENALWFYYGIPAKSVRIGDNIPVKTSTVQEMLQAIGHSRELQGEYLTLGEADEIMQQFNPQGRNFYITDENSLISYALWVDLFTILLQQNHNPETKIYVPLTRNSHHYVNYFMYQEIEIIYLNGEVAAVLGLVNPLPTIIRVAIGASNFAGLIHESVTITSNGEFTIRRGDRTETFLPNQHFAVRNTDDLWGEEYIQISTVSPSSRLEIVGLRRSWPDNQSPSYRGILEISPLNGGFVIINELPMEEYLKAVVPSEMPSSFGVEASKIQAVTARSFAYHQFHANLFQHVGAHVDDSVISQVYNNIPENEISIAAVNATRGQVLTLGGEIVIVNYFSTSGGTTANFGEVWAAGSEFPSETPPHLRATPQFHMEYHSPGDLSVEYYASAFFRNPNIPAFDSGLPWFRWQIKKTAEELSDRINRNLPARQAANPLMVSSAGGIGHLQHIEIIRRGEGGNIMEIQFCGTDGSANVNMEFNIRSILAPGSIPVTRNDGSQITGLSLLPSAFFTIQKHTAPDNTLTAVTFYGGGNGHGVGMSQNGAYALLNLGLTYREVLMHFYPQTEIRNLTGF